MYFFDLGAYFNIWITRHLGINKITLNFRNYSNQMTQGPFSVDKYIPNIIVQHTECKHHVLVEKQIYTVFY